MRGPRVRKSSRVYYVRDVLIRNIRSGVILLAHQLRCVLLEWPMAPRANWKGYLRLSLVTCPVALFPATSESEKVSFNQINQQDRPPHQVSAGRRRDRRRRRERRHRQGLQGRHRHLHRGRQGRTRQHRAGVDPHHRHRPVRAAQRDRRSLYRAALLPRAGRQGRPRRLCGHPRHHQGDRQGRAGARGADQPRARRSRWKPATRAWSACCCAILTKSASRPNTSTASRT